MRMKVLMTARNKVPQHHVWKKTLKPNGNDNRTMWRIMAVLGREPRKQQSIHKEKPGTGKD